MVGHRQIISLSQFLSRPFDITTYLSDMERFGHPEDGLRGTSGRRETSIAICTADLFENRNYDANGTFHAHCLPFMFTFTFIVMFVP
jgi:hypothetical protein